MPTVGALMTIHTDRVPLGASIGEAVARMVDAQVSAVVVVDHDRICGIVTEHDVVHVLGEHLPPETPVATVMSSPVLAVSADTDTHLAHRMALGNRIRHLVVTDSAGHPLGIVTETDFRHHLGLDFFRQFSTVASLMNPGFIRLAGECPLEAAAHAMDQADATCALICEGNGLLGIVTERDVTRLFATASAQTPIAQVMTSPVQTIDPERPLVEAVALMQDRRFRHLPVVDANGHLHGLLTEHDLMRPLELDRDGDSLYDQAYYQQALLDNFPFMVWLKDTDSRLLAVNQTYADVCGEKNPEALIGKTDQDLFPLALAAQYQADDQAVMASGQRKQVEEQIVVAGQPSWFETYKAPVFGPDGQAMGTVGFARNIAERKRQEEAAILRHAALAGLVRGDCLSGILDLLVLALEREFPSWRCSVLLLDTDGRHLRHGSAPHLPDHYNQAVDGIAVGEGIGSCGTAAFRGERVVVADVLNHPFWASFADLARSAGIRACWSEPIRGAGNEIMGTFAAYHDAVTSPSPEDIEHLVRHSQLIGLVLSHLRHQEIVHNSQVTFRNIFESIDQAVLVLDGNFNCLDANQGALQLFGREREALIGQSAAKLSAPWLNDPRQGEALLRQAMAGTPQVFQHWGRNQHRQPFLLEARAQACQYYGKPALVVALQDITERHHANLRLEIEHDLAIALTSGEDREHILHTMLQTILRLPDLDCGGIYWREKDGGFRLVTQQSLPADYVASATRLPADSPQAAIIREGRIVCSCEHLSLHCTETGFVSSQHLHDNGFCCLTIFPITLHGLIVACFTLGSRDSKQLSKSTLVALESLSLNFSQTLVRLQAEEHRRLAASVFDNAHEGIMITDAAGVLVEVNDTFTELTGYTREEALGRNADLLKSGHHDAAFYAGMWATIKATGFWRGEVWNRKKSGEIFVELLTISTVHDTAGRVTHYVGIFSDITLQKEHQKRLEHLAHFDPLTQLPNRMLLADRLQVAMAQAQRSKRLLAVCYLDLDGFKPVNDTLGHAAGDRLLVEVAQRLKICLRSEDTVARLGGDEFVLLFSGLNDDHECDRALSRVISHLAAPFFIAQQEVCISASIGVTIYPTDAGDADTLLRHADQAMYSAKQLGRNRYHLFDPERDRRTRVRREELTQIQGALERGEFVLHYQPKVDMRNGQVVGAEALIRWQHPERGLVLPGEFLPIVEGTDLDVAIGNWVLAEAIAQIARWQSLGLNLCVSVNIAGAHLLAPNFVAHLRQLLDLHPEVLPRHLELEILETAALDDMNAVAGIFEQCHQLGVSFSLDDFGTGYSSLTYFRRLPAGTLKIDQSFVRDMLDDPEDLAIVEGVIGLTRAFNRRVIAEGVESIEHGMVLLQLGCDLGQGFGIARPMPAKDLPAWVAGFKPDILWDSSTAFHWSKEDLPILVAEIEHRRWKHHLLDYLDDIDGKIQPPTRNPHDCRFGRWYYGPGRQRYGALQAFQALEEVHNRIHRVGKSLIDLRREVVAIPTASRDELEALSRELQDSLHNLQGEILVAGNGRQPLSV